MSILTCNRISKSYGRDSLTEHVLKEVTWTFRGTEACVLLGPSGSGKTTLLSIFGCLLAPSSGELTIAGQSVEHDRPSRLTALRREKIGFIFQHSQLLPFLSVEENLRIVAKNSRLCSRNAEHRIAELTELLGIAAYRHRKPAELSGGQRQRVAIARAVLHRPLIVLADEPTASLDWANGQAAMRLLVQQAKAENSLLIVVTHDTRLLPLFDRVLHMNSGQIQEGIPGMASMLPKGDY